METIQLDAMQTNSTSIDDVLLDMYSDTDSETEEPQRKPFPFFDLPFELRGQVLENVLRVKRVIDIDFNVSGITSIFLVSKQFHEESAAVFFSRNTFRLFPTHSRAVHKRSQPLIRMFPSRYRRLITKLEYRLGPFWTCPPYCWKVDIKLGLKDLVRVRRLDVFIELDPSASMYHGYRRSETFYTDFSAKLFEGMLRRMPALKEIRLDTYPSVSPTGALVQTLVRLAQNRNKSISWGAGISVVPSKPANLDIGCITSALDSLSLQLLAPHA